MLRRLAVTLALSAFAFTVPAYAASKTSSKKPAATKSAKKPAPKKSVAAPAPAATPEATPAPVAKKPSKKLDRAFIRTTRAGWQEVVVGDKVIATRADGSKVNGTIREVSDYEITIESPRKSEVTIARNDLAQVFHDGAAKPASK